MPENSKAKKRQITICLFLILLTLAVFAQVREFDFLNYDDDTYITANTNIQKGISLHNIYWALTAEVSGNWHPVTLVSHMLDYHLFGLDAGKHHLTNLLFHVANSLLLFIILCRLSPTLYQNAFIVSLFAIHPLHVESVAWISERKDLLCTFFFLLGLWSYIKYTSSRKITRYLAVLIFFGLGLASKPMIVTFPFILILLDLWPLERIHFSDSAHGVDWTTMNKLLIEKIPLFFLSIISSITTVYFQKSGEAIASINHFSLFSRIFNAIVTYVVYLKKTFWPFDLAIFYPHPGHFPISLTITSLLLLILISVFAIISIKNYPWFFTGWFWYMGTLVPVIGIVQVGSQSMADRYTYIPLIGIFFILVHGISLFLSKTGIRFAKFPAFITIIILAAISWHQVRFFRNSRILFEHALATTNGSAIVHNNYGEALVKEDMPIKAAHHFAEAIRITPSFETAHNNLGNVLAKLGNPEKAEYHYRQAIQLDPNYADAYNNLGALMYSQKKYKASIKCFKSALRIDPDSYAAKHNLNIVLKYLNGKQQK